MYKRTDKKGEIKRTDKRTDKRMDKRRTDGIKVQKKDR